MQAGLDTQRGRHIDLSQRGHRDGVTGALGQVDGTECQVDGQQVPPGLLPCGDTGQRGVSRVPRSSPWMLWGTGPTSQVQLVQSVVGHGCVAGALSDVGAGRGVWAQPPSAGSQPAAHPEALEQVAEQAPQQAAGQVPVGGGQRAAQGPQCCAQVLGPLCEVPLGQQSHQWEEP